MGGTLTEKPPTRRPRKKATNTPPGMVPAEQWKQTAVHQASNYFCAKCGRRFDSPDAVYEHLDTKHPKRKGSRNGHS
jgi:hypothetical protein